MDTHLGDIVGDPVMMPHALLHPTIDKLNKKKSRISLSSESWTNQRTEVALEARK